MPLVNEAVRPRVSICVPNLNTCRFLPERFETIRAQTLQDWEALVYDSHSDDGAWDYICDEARREPRMRAWQGPREGTPGSWSPCVREARGEYVYIATSDDTMPPDCLEKLVAALDAHPECDLAHCPLRAIDEKSLPATDRKGRELSELYAQYSLFARSSAGLLDAFHIRRAPYDGLLHLVGETIYISITQLLIRRSLFDRIGFFASKWGPVGDFQWSMKAGLVANTIHVPDTWGGWRVHPSQATAAAGIGTAGHASRMESMIDEAIATSKASLPPVIHQYLTSKWAVQAKEFRAFERELAQHEPSIARKGWVVRRLFAGSLGAREHMKSRLLNSDTSWRESFPDRVRAWLDEVGFGPVLVPTRGPLSHSSERERTLPSEVKSTV